MHKIQHLDPIGVGATSLKDSLLIQLSYFHKENKYFDIARNMIEKLEDDIKPSMISYDSFISEFKKNDEAKDIVKSLNPKPGNIISDSLHQEHITPDIIVVKKDAKWIVELNPSINPKIRINKAYKEIMESIKNKDDQEYVKTNLQDAKFFLKALNNRNLTILKTAKLIFQKQKEFIHQGEIAMKPLSLKDIAIEIKMHESTISRCTNNKYVQTPRGVYEMKYFFSSEISTDHGKMLSSTAIKSMISKVILNEDKKQPLSDQDISKSFNDNGIKVARRTIAKYRENLSIPTSKYRKIK